MNTLFLESDQTFRENQDLQLKYVYNIDTLEYGNWQFVASFTCNISSQYSKIGRLKITLQLELPTGPRRQERLRYQLFNEPNLMCIDAVNQGNWSLSIELRIECFVIVEDCKHYARALTYSPKDSKIQGCSRCQFRIKKSYSPFKQFCKQCDQIL